MKPTGLTVHHEDWKIVEQILERYAAPFEVWAFGSRVRGTTKAMADLDLALITEQALSLEVHADLTEAFTEADLPWRVDVVDWSTTSPEFRRIIEREKIVVKTREKSLSSPEAVNLKFGGAGRDRTDA